MLGCAATPHTCHKTRRRLCRGAGTHAHGLLPRTKPAQTVRCGNRCAGVCAPACPRFRAARPAACVRAHARWKDIFLYCTCVCGCAHTHVCLFQRRAVLARTCSRAPGRTRTLAQRVPPTPAPPATVALVHNIDHHHALFTFDCAARWDAGPGVHVIQARSGCRIPTHEDRRSCRARRRVSGAD